MSNIRRSYSPALKSKIAMEAVKQERTIAQLSSHYGVHPNMITRWKKHLLTELPGIFSNKRKKTDQEAQKLQEELYRQIGKLKVELDWLKKKSEQLC